MKEKNTVVDPTETGTSSINNAAKRGSRRKFLGLMGAALTGGMTLGKASFASAQSDASDTIDGVQLPDTAMDTRVKKSFSIRVRTATKEAHIPVPPHTTNGDEERYDDKSGTYTKGILQDGIGLVNANAYRTFKRALNSGRGADFENIIVGGTRTLNGPQGGLAFALEGTDAVQFGNASSPANQENGIVVAPAPAVASDAYGTELVEMYWGSLLRDIAFTDYASSEVAAQAAGELSGMPTYAGPRDTNGLVTPNLLFRGPYPGDTVGPYISQFFLIPTFLGAQGINQQMLTYAAGVDYMTDPTTFQQVQNGVDTGLRNQLDPQPRYIHDGRGLAAFTHVDVLYQAYFTAYMVLGSIGAPVNPGNPYVASRTQNGFGTFGGPDFAAALTAVAGLAVNNVWYQKWYIHLRHRPESGGAILRQILTGNGGTIDATLSDNVLNSVAVQSSFNTYGDYFLSQAFPEGSPTHPAYPTGHGTVAGACITVLKFFFDGNFVVPNPVVPSSDGLSLLPYTGGDAGQITVNGELNKLANNVSFGHGIHAGIHWRSDTDSSIKLGEAVAISVLQDRALTYNEKFTVNLTKIDGTIATISNQ
ncbi:MAG TPA: vanadium-dependent haloperoxidase [Candidatus Udaeobacter sp.]|nr:vanadium-dependent haloperoxidase [Candidatus Udaeobacter sp.]